MHRSGGLWGIVQQHGVALHGLLGISELTPCAQKRREAGRPVGADMAPDDPVLLRQLTRTDHLSELTQQDGVVRRHVGPHRPACLPPFLCTRGQFGDAE